MNNNGMEDKIEEGTILGAKEPVPIKKSDFKDKENCICKINGNKIGTGFFCKINFIKVLITNYHVINDEFLKDKNKLKVYIKDKYKIIRIYENSIIYLSENNKYDIIIIRVNEDEIKDYLEIDENIFNHDSELSYEDEDIFILHYPNAGEGMVSSGKGIKKIKERKYDISHLCNTDSGSSGAPILSYMTKKVIGVHKACIKNKNYNIGTFLKFPLNEIKFENLTKKNVVIDLANISSIDNKLYPPLTISRLSKSICKIVIKGKMSSGFLIKFFKGEEDFFCLMTNEHIITKELIKQKKLISIYYDNESKLKEIKLEPEERYIKEFREDINIDATIVEILPKDGIEKEFFLLPLLEYMNNYNELINKEITIIQYPLRKLSYSNGIIKKIDEYEFTQLSSTKNGSSGSPVFLKDSEKVIGIHKGGNNKNENYGDFIGPIFNYIRNKFNYKIFLENGNYYIGELNKNLKNGKGIIYYNNGNIKYNGYFIKDKFEGKGKEYNDEGNLEFEGEYLNGKKWNGKGKEYNCNGKLKFEGEYLNGKRNGKGKVYNYYGILIFEGEYLNGERNGKGKEYNDNGKLEFEGEYLNGKRWNGKGYNHKGEFGYELIQGNGKVKEYNKDGKLYFEGEYLNGKRWNGKVKEYYYDGELYFEGEYLKGKRNGKGKEYYHNGKLKFEGEYLNGERNGKGKEYNKDGELEFEGEYLNGKRWNGKGKDNQYDINIPHQSLFNMANPLVNHVPGLFETPKRLFAFSPEVDSIKYAIVANSKNLKKSMNNVPDYARTLGDNITKAIIEFLRNKINSDERLRKYNGNDKLLADVLAVGFWDPKHLYGKLEFEGEYSNGKRNGKCKEYNDNGELKFEGEYLNGKRNGKGKEYNFFGKLEFEGEYLNGERNGKGKEYNYNGNLEFEGEYLNGERNGKGKEYNYNGKLKFEGEYLNGKRNGKGKEYDYFNEILIFEGEYLNGVRNGKGKEYNYNGELKFEGEYLNGERKGKKVIMMKNTMFSNNH